MNPVSLLECRLNGGGISLVLCDISFLRAVTEKKELGVAVGDELTVELVLERHRFAATMALQAAGESFLRFAFTRLVPSGQASLRAFLSPRKVGESLIPDWTADRCRHFHGLNESELWVGANGDLMFSFLDQGNTGFQFVLHISNDLGIRAGRIPRKEYMALENIDSDLPLATANADRETYLKLGECRDIVTNFRPTTQADYSLKTRLLKTISDHLYSTTHKVEWTPIRPSTRMSSPPTDLN
ncbi:MAG: hypothetical protein HYR96_12235 [Deltaproteobacteria bacterium]|nr:hypothetical protein [Deltaproteobacteria bacterium]MBI3296023.1 hypothetical protein [Deltaproteobacteria bacterium]